jgi:flagella basal body P-ring formation protein FlgA
MVWGHDGHSGQRGFAHEPDKGALEPPIPSRGGAALSRVRAVNSRFALMPLLAGLALGLSLHAQTPPGAGLPADAVQQALALAGQAAQALAPPGARVLESAPAPSIRACNWPPAPRSNPRRARANRPGGRTRIALRCLEGTSRWNVSLPVTVQVFAPAVVLATALPAGATLDTTALTLAEVDWGAASGQPFANARRCLGRVLARPLAAGQAPRAGPAGAQVVRFQEKPCRSWPEGPALSSAPKARP